jgi:membrane-associated protease RseP (regulator of RpoE activity)
MSADSTAPKSTWHTNLALFIATVASVLFTGISAQRNDGDAGFASLLHMPSRTAIIQGAQFAGTLLVILVAHELGHYVAAKIHRVEASLPYFIPLPLLSPFGTMGAVIRMRGTIATRRALLDIGASGPIAGLVFAIPLYMYGAAHSHIVPIPGPDDGSYQLGESILIKLLDHAFAPAKTPGTDLELSPIAFGAWGGMFVTMINLLPVGQLDGGHVAYSLFGDKQDRFARTIHRAMLAFFFVSLFGRMARDFAGGIGIYHLGRNLNHSLFWFVWFQVLAIIGLLAADRSTSRESMPIGVRVASTLGLVILAGMAHDHASRLLPLSFFVGLALLLAMEVKGGVLRKHELLTHPPTSTVPLDPVRKVIAALTLAMFVLLFMPEPFTL